MLRSPWPRPESLHTCAPHRFPFPPAPATSYTYLPRRGNALACCMLRMHMLTSPALKGSSRRAAGAFRCRGRSEERRSQEMDGHGEMTAFEVGIAVPRRREDEGGEGDDCADFLIRQLKKVGLIVERVDGVSDVFIKLAASVETLGRAATDLQMKKLTYIGINLRFEWEQNEAFVRQPDGSLFSWCERFQCFQHLIYGIVNNTGSASTLFFRSEEFIWASDTSLLKQMESEGIVKEVFPLHDETKRKQLLRTWALNLSDITWQPIDEIYLYFGSKIATYFSFLGMYARWMLFPASFGLAVQFIDFGSWQFLVLPVFFAFIISWAVFFFQFWKRKNSSLLARWGITPSQGMLPGNRVVDTNSGAMLQTEMEKKLLNDKPMRTEKLRIQREEWIQNLVKIRNNVIAVLAVICLQLPFELIHAYIYEMVDSDVIKYGLTALYIFAIQNYKKIGGKLAAKLIKYERNKGEQSTADSLAYKVFSLYFMQSYVGLFYHILLHRNFATLRQILIQRLIVSQVLQNFLENAIPYINYRFKKYKALHKKKHETGTTVKPYQVASRVEKEYLKPSYSASIGAEFDDGLFDDFLELALQFGMIMMFACAFPPVFCFALLGNVTEIRADAVKFLVMLRRPAPRAAATIGAWFNIFQFLIVMSICTNCALLICMYDREGKWKLEPGLAAILVMEHVLLLVKFGFSHFVPEEPAWIKANRVQNIEKAQDLCSKQLLRSTPEEKKIK